MFCNNCGRDIGDADKCPDCGREANAQITLPKYEGPLEPVVPADEALLASSMGTKPRKIDPVLSLPLSGWWQRVGSTIIDGLIIGGVGLVLNTAITVLSTRTAIQWVIQFGYMVLLWTSVRGQTVGNRAVKTKVIVGRDGARVPIGRAIVRWLAITLPSILAFTFTWHQYSEFAAWAKANPNISATTIPNYIISDLRTFFGALAVAGIYSLVDISFPAWDKRSRTLHDIIAGTVVVQAP
jgi:uncharacterized RDD family membrane protein YckC